MIKPFKKHYRYFFNQKQYEDDDYRHFIHGEWYNMSGRQRIFEVGERVKVYLSPDPMKHSEWAEQYGNREGIITEIHDDWGPGIDLVVKLDFGGEISMPSQWFDKIDKTDIRYTQWDNTDRYRSKSQKKGYK